MVALFQVKSFYFSLETLYLYELPGHLANLKKAHVSWLVGYTLFWLWGSTLPF